jgi:hypothetical protein
MNKKLSITFSIIIAALPVAVSAAVAPDQFIITILNNFLGFILWPIFIGAIIIMLLWAGFLFVTAQGDPGKIGTAKKTALWAVVGIVVGIFAYSAYSIVARVLGPVL